MERAMFVDRRSGRDDRSETEKLLTGERRAANKSALQRAPRPSVEQLSLFARRLRRAMRDERARHFFGVASGEGDIAFFPEVLRLLEWIDGSAASPGEDEELYRQRPGTPPIA
jgi:hypothetical protein